MPVQTVTVFHTVNDERGQPIAGVPVRIRLARHRFVRSQQIEILQWGVTTQTDATGTWSVDLVPNSLTDDPQSFYIVEEGQEGTPVYHVHYIRVPEGVTSVWLGDIVLYDLSSEPSLAPVFANVVRSLRAQGQALLKGDVILKAGTNVTLVQDNIEKSITINAVGGGGGGGGGAHNLLDGSVHPDTAATTVSRGMVIVGRQQADLSTKWQGLALGASGTVLKSNGTDALCGNVDWAEVQNKPATFPPSPHTHDAADIASGRFSASRLPTSPNANRFLVVRTANSDPTYDTIQATDLPTHTHSPSQISPQGSGSGLDADTVDGQHASAFAPASHTHNAADVAAGQFGANTGGGNYSFPGNVGIGTAGPIRKLHIVDNVSANVESLLIQNNGARASLRLYGKSSLDAGSASANVQFVDQDTPHTAHIVFESRETNAPLTVWINGARRLGIYGASTPGMSVGSYAEIVPPSDGMIIPGNVGIGTAAPTARLHVVGATGYNQLRLQMPYTPTSSADPNGNVGDIAWDDNYIYVKTSSGWKRAALSSF